MKITEIEIKGKCILLGIFGTPTYEYFENHVPSVYGYGSFNSWFPGYRVLEIVEYVCNVADKIIFVLDDVHFPINPKDSITCAELQIICENEEFFEKTIFVKGDNVIEFDKNLVI